MNRPELFRLEFKDPVVQYYFIPGRSDIRLTVRFGQVLVHREIYEAAMKNFVWRQEGPDFNSLIEAEKYANNLLSGSVSNLILIKSEDGFAVSESLLPYTAA